MLHQIRTLHFREEEDPMLVAIEMVLLAAVVLQVRSLAVEKKPVPVPVRHKR